MTFLVSTYYECDSGVCADRDNAAMDAVGRDAEETGWGCGERDLGWLCESEDEAAQVKSALENIGMDVTVLDVEVV